MERSFAHINFSNRHRPGGELDWSTQAIGQQHTSPLRARCEARRREVLDWTTQAIGQQHTSSLRAGCEARRREIVVIFGCGNGLTRDAPEASKVDGGRGEKTNYRGVGRIRNIHAIIF